MRLILVESAPCHSKGFPCHPRSGALGPALIRRGERQHPPALCCGRGPALTQAASVPLELGRQLPGSRTHLASSQRTCKQRRSGSRGVAQPGFVHTRLKLAGRSWAWLSSGCLCRASAAVVLWTLESAPPQRPARCEERVELLSLLSTWMPTLAGVGQPPARCLATGLLFFKSSRLGVMLA